MTSRIKNPTSNSRAHTQPQGHILDGVESRPTDTDEFGDETQRNETIETEQGLNQKKFRNPEDDGIERE
ncbi:MAG: hypothetical protein ABI304_00775 [Rudaea sp.]